MSNDHQIFVRWVTLLSTILAMKVCFLCNTQVFGQSGSLYRNPRPVRFTQTAAIQQQPANPAPYGTPNQGIAPDGWGPTLPGQGIQGNLPGASMNSAALNGPLLDPGLAQNPLAAASWTFVPPTQARNLRVHDIISIRVSETAQSIAQGMAQSRKTASYDARLSDWIRLVGFDTLKPGKQKDGDQRIGGQENEVYRANSDLQTREQVTFNIAAEIADIRPNGNLVLSAHKNIKLNDNDWEVALTGICRPQDVGPDNVILSKDIIDLNVNKVERGHVRDGYSRGWFTRWLARFKAF